MGYLPYQLVSRISAINYTSRFCSDPIETYADARQNAHHLPQVSG